MLCPRYNLAIAFDTMAKLSEYKAFDFIPRIPKPLKDYLINLDFRRIRYEKNKNQNVFCDIVGLNTYYYGLVSFFLY
jgi:hypothetical protein